MGLKRISFEGFQEPTYFYKRPLSFFCMTSSSESFGLVLLEAMQYNVVPFAFNSYLSVTDIIEDKVNGVLIPPFNCELYAKELSKMMIDEVKRIEMAQNAKIKSSEFSIETIGESWSKLITENDG